MTEAEWMTCCNPLVMMKSMRGPWQRRRVWRDRKLRLFAVACARLVIAELTDPRSRAAIDAAERYADGEETEAELAAAREQAGQAHLLSFSTRKKHGACLEWAAEYAAEPPAFHAASSVSWMAATGRMLGEITAANHIVQANLLRDLFGNPFGPDPSPDLARSSTEVVGLAQAIYNGRSFDRMPDLAEALERAGYTDSEVLAHCRRPGPHVRGCWVVDLILGKS